MRTFILCVALVGLTVVLLGPPAGLVLSPKDCVGVSGGCTAENKSPCANAVIVAEKYCEQCYNTQRQCDNAHADERCTSLYNTSAEDCISCGTCSEPCGGVQRTYNIYSDCKGTFTTTSCGENWTDAQNGTCLQACPPGG